MKRHFLILASVVVLGFLPLVTHADPPGPGGTQTQNPTGVPAGAATESSCSGGFGGIGNLIKLFSNPNECLFPVFANILLSLVGQLLKLTGALFNLAMVFTLDIAYYTEQMHVNEAWKVIRDLVNIIFIFALLWIAISTILDIGDYKKYLAGLIVSALLINFSLFFTKAIIDATNILAIQFYSSVTGGNWNSADPDIDGGISAQFMDRLKITTVFSAGNNSVDAEALRKTGNIVLLSIFGSIFLLITAAVFLVAGLMMMARSAILIFLMITSPVGFLGGWLPKVGEWSKEWWSLLWNQALVAPVFLIMVWIVLRITDTMAITEKLGRGQQANFASAITGNNSNALAVVLQYLLVIAFIIAALNITRKLSGEAGAKFSSFGQKAIGTVAGGVSGAILRRTVGAKAYELSQNKDWRAEKEKSLIGRMQLASVDYASKANYDVRGAVKSLGGIPGMDRTGIDFGAAAGKGGFEKIAKDKAKTIEASDKALEEQYNHARARRLGLSSSQIEQDINGMKERNKERKQEFRTATLDSRQKGLGSIWNYVSGDVKGIALGQANLEAKAYKEGERRRKKNQGKDLAKKISDLKNQQAEADKNWRWDPEGSKKKKDELQKEIDRLQREADDIADDLAADNIKKAAGDAYKEARESEPKEEKEEKGGGGEEKK